MIEQLTDRRYRFSLLAHIFMRYTIYLGLSWVSLFIDQSMSILHEHHL